MPSFFYTGYPLSLIFGNGVSLRVVVDIYPRRWQKVSRTAHFLRLLLGEKLVWGVNRCAGLGNGQRPFPVETGSGKEGKVREERRAFRRRIIRILLFEDENLFLSFITATV